MYLQDNRFTMNLLLILKIISLKIQMQTNLDQLEHNQIATFKDRLEKAVNISQTAPTIK